MVMNRWLWLLLVFASGFGCGKEERSEAVRLLQLLAQQQPEFASANALERDFVASARAWSGTITGNGSGKGAQLQQNADRAAELANAAAAISAKIGRVRQAVYDEALRKEYPQSVRFDLITQLTKRQRTLQDLRALLQQSVPEFLQNQKNKDYAGDTYPNSISKLDAVLKSYSEPENPVQTALAGLKTKYGLTGKEL
jgi:hypothetical protein